MVPDSVQRGYVAAYVAGFLVVSTTLGEFPGSGGCLRFPGVLLTHLAHVWRDVIDLIYTGVEGLCNMVTSARTNLIQEELVTEQLGFREGSV